MDRIEVLHGTPPCPECNRLLHLRSMPDAGETYWHCTGCGTQWSTPDLIIALNDVEDYACVVAMERADLEDEDGATELG